jgi:hypothetical protein
MATNNGRRLPPTHNQPQSCTIAALNASFAAGNCHDKSARGCLPWRAVLRIEWEGRGEEEVALALRTSIGLQPKPTLPRTPPLV